MIDFDEIQTWSVSLSQVLQPHLPLNAQELLSASGPEDVSDALDILFELGCREKIINTTLSWAREETLVAYHGTRLTEDEIISVRQIGLQPLRADSRRIRLTRALSTHPNWQNVVGRLDDELLAHGPGQQAGGREGQVHLTLSHSGLTESFNHYLKYGSELDQHVAESLLGNDGVELLAHDGMSMVLKFGVPGNLALMAAHPIFDVSYMLDHNKVPNIVGEFLRAWSYSLAYPSFEARSLQLDCGLRFNVPVPADWLIDVERLGSD